MTRKYSCCTKVTTSSNTMYMDRPHVGEIRAKQHRRHDFANL